MTNADAFLFIFAAAIIWCGTAALLLRMFYALDRLSDRRRARRAR